MDLRYNDIYLKGLAEGKEEGLAQGKKEAKERWTIKIISNCLKQNLSLEDIASLTEISVEEVKQYIKDNHLDKKKTKKRSESSPSFLFFSIFLSF